MQRILTVFSIFLIVCSQAYAANNISSLAEKALLSMGNTARLQNTMLKAKNGESLVIGFLGGSITQGARASRGDRTYVYYVASWWEKRFPKANFKFVNAGIGATGSDIGAFRIHKHLLKYSPDFVVVEFAVTDRNTKESAETMEGITRQILKAPNHPSMIYLFMCNVMNGKYPVNAQEWHSKIGFHYGIPMISFADAIWPEIQSGRMKSEEIFADGLHPNDIGHKYAAESIISFLNKVYGSLENSKPTAVSTLPKPFISDRYVKTAFSQPGDIEPNVNNGWSVTRDNRFQKAWSSNRAGNVIGFNIEGKEISILFNHFSNAGIIAVKVDDLPEKTIDAFMSSYPKPRVEKVFKGDKISKHKIRIKIVDKKNAKSNGYNFNLLALMITL